MATTALAVRDKNAKHLGLFMVQDNIILAVEASANDLELLSFILKHYKHLKVVEQEYNRLFKGMLREGK